MSGATERSLSTQWFDSAFADQKVIAVFRGADADQAVALAESAWDLGIRNVEIPIESPAAVPALAAVCRRASELGHAVGAGTILTEEQLDICIEVGAAYAVSPGLDVRMHELASARQLPLLPGVATPSEILLARQLGFTWVKAFPAYSLGLSWFTLAKAPFPDIRIVATGGMTPSNAPTFLGAGVDIVGFGSVLAEPEERSAMLRLLNPSG